MSRGISLPAPYIVYTKIIYELCKEPLETAEDYLQSFDVSRHLYESLQWAVNRCIRIAKKYECVLVSDVVGMGKTFVGSDVTTGYASDLLSAGGDHHVVGYGRHIHVPAQDLISNEVAYRGTLEGCYTELQELMALVAMDAVTLRSERFGFGAINDVAARLGAGKIEGHAVITPP